MAVVREQLTASDAHATPIVESFGSTPTQGNLLVCTAMQRAAVNNPSISGTGWTERVDFQIQISNESFRQQLFIWTKTAGASEPTQVTVTPSPSENMVMILQEFSGVSESDYVEAANDHNDETDTVSTVDNAVSGTTSSLASGEYFLLSNFVVKGNTTAVCTDYVVTGWTPDNGDHTTTSTSTRILGTAWAEGNYSGTQSVTGTYTTSTISNRGIGHSLMVFSIPSGTSIPLFMNTYRQRRT